MKYYKVVWDHEFADEPVQIYSEVADDGYEVRKVEVYSDNSYGVASSELNVGDTYLSDLPFPDVDELGAEEEFTPVVIEEKEFEEIWLRAQGLRKTLLSKLIGFIKQFFRS